MSNGGTTEMFPSALMLAALGGMEALAGERYHPAETYRLIDGDIEKSMTEFAFDSVPAPKP